MVRLWALVLFVSVLVVGFFQSANATEAQNVTDEATQASEIEFPHISSGPGFITPDSQFYFLDKAYQNFRLALLGPQERAKLRTQIAGERMAELRLMMAKDHDKGIRNALYELSEEQRKAASDLALAQGEGDDVTDTAVEINSSIKEQRKALKELIDQARGALKLRLETARLALKESKVEIEDNLPEDVLAQEIEDDLSEIIEEETGSTVDSARRLENAIMRLDELASQAALRNQERRYEALQRAIDVKNDALVRQRERILELEERKAQKLLELKERKEEAVSNARLRAEEARKVIEEAEQEFENSEKEIEKEFEDFEKSLPPQAKADRE